MPPARKYVVTHKVAVVNSWIFLALGSHTFFKTTTATAWHCESLQWYIILSQSANPAVFPQRFRADCNWAPSSAAGCVIDKWPNSHLYQSAYADKAPNISMTIRLLTTVQHSPLLIQKQPSMIQLHLHYTQSKLGSFTGRGTLVKRVGKKHHTHLWQLCWQTPQRCP